MPDERKGEDAGEEWESERMREQKKGGGGQWGLTLYKQWLRLSDSQSDTVSSSTSSIYTIISPTIHARMEYTNHFIAEKLTIKVCLCIPSQY